MSWSLGEIKSLALKASKGAGLSWGEAEELAFATDWLNRQSVPGVLHLAAYLDWRSDPESYVQDCDPIVKISQILDFDAYDAAFPANVCQPILLVPSIAMTLGEQKVVMRFSDVEICVSPTTCAVVTGNPDLSQSTEYCTLAPGEFVDLQIEAQDRVGSEMKDAVNDLQRYAQRTYAPATESSRTAGAGAGDDGND